MESSSGLTVSPIHLKMDQKLLSAALIALAAGQYQYGLMLGINETAKAVELALKAAMPQKLDRPRKFTINSLYTKFARDKRNPEAEVLYRQFAGKGTPAARYLIPQVEGGLRPHKRHERALQARGKLPRHKFLVPGVGVKKDAYGNVPGSVYTKILSALRAQHDEAQNTKTGGKFFFGSPGGAALGIYRRYDHDQVFPYFIAVNAPKFQTRFPFFEIGNAEMERVYAENVMKGFDRALATARY